MCGGDSTSSIWLRCDAGLAVAVTAGSTAVVEAVAIGISMVMGWVSAGTDLVIGATTFATIIA